MAPTTPHKENAPSRRPLAHVNCARESVGPRGVWNGPTTKCDPASCHPDVGDRPHTAWEWHDRFAISGDGSRPEAERRQECVNCEALRNQLVWATNTASDARTQAQEATFALSEARQALSESLEKTGAHEREKAELAEKLQVALLDLEEQRNEVRRSGMRWQEESETWRTFYHDAKASADEAKAQRAEAVRTTAQAQERLTELQGQVRCLQDELDMRKVQHAQTAGKWETEVEAVAAELDALRGMVADSYAVSSSLQASRSEFQDQLHVAQLDSKRQSGLREDSERRCNILERELAELQDKHKSETGANEVLQQKFRQTNTLIEDLQRKVQEGQSKIEEQASCIERLRREKIYLEEARRHKHERRRVSPANVRSKMQRYHSKQADLQRLYEERSAMSSALPSAMALSGPTSPCSTMLYDPPPLPPWESLAQGSQAAGAQAEGLCLGISDWRNR